MTAIVKNILTDKLPMITQTSFVIDGANVALEVKNSKGKAQIQNLKIIMEKFDAMGISGYKIICDYSLYSRMDDRKVYSNLVKAGKIIETPSGIEADVIILQYAYDNNAYIISNDKFRDYYDIFDENWINKVRMSFLFINDEIYLDKLIKLSKK